MEAPKPRCPNCLSRKFEVEEDSAYGSTIRIKCLDCGCPYRVQSRIIPKAPIVYPLTAVLEEFFKHQRSEFWKRAAGELRGHEVEQAIGMLGACERIIMVFGEYEHGTANIEDLHPDLTLGMAKLLIEDLILSVLNWTEKP